METLLNSEEYLAYKKEAMRTSHNNKIYTILVFIILEIVSLFLLIPNDVRLSIPLLLLGIFISLLFTCILMFCVYLIEYLFIISNVNLPFMIPDIQSEEDILATYLEYNYEDIDLKDVIKIVNNTLISIESNDLTLSNLGKKLSDKEFTDYLNFAKKKYLIVYGNEYSNSEEDVQKEILKDLSITQLKMLPDNLKVIMEVQILYKDMLRSNKFRELLMELSELVENQSDDEEKSFSFGLTITSKDIQDMVYLEDVTEHLMQLKLESIKNRQEENETTEESVENNVEDSFITIGEFKDFYEQLGGKD